ncbi:hypothetical protein BU26DRAFT_551523 [Trematosphaeria pertusa]|uniref:Uncharacterized protein n=1 Tax=Trematosphaeria pertusa TaxID=390896 RepID=A0A6A6IDL2_9PLEO|nr:uncharacterized protein BU26DRAFT_551523 [Trematosphaeria pertusa]KAF2248148.1 hypothetical protein BU26DRAFT_551523 [Trematosphaeria pertusa]
MASLAQASAIPGAQIIDLSGSGSGSALLTPSLLLAAFALGVAISPLLNPHLASLLPSPSTRTGDSKNTANAPKEKEKEDSHNGNGNGNESLAQRIPDLETALFAEHGIEKDATHVARNIAQVGGSTTGQDQGIRYDIANRRKLCGEIAVDVERGAEGFDERRDLRENEAGEEHEGYEEHCGAD